ncbi:MAG: DUF448 domain-containing protein [Leptotrichiaceae bacterium]|nr:DUF448 domain-containing protein [Leptotrichiaceae bacterium]
MPERMCICCRNKGKKEGFFRISLIDSKYVFDENMKIQSRGTYICKKSQCIEKLSKHKKYNIEITELLKMLKKIEKTGKNIIDILRPMKNSEYFIFGIDENIEGVKKNKVKLLIIPSDINKKYIEEFIKLKEKFNVKIIEVERKTDLRDIFQKDVNVIGIFDKKVVNGILNKVEVTDESKSTRIG